MKLIKPNFEIITQNPNNDGMLKHIELCGRVCYKSEDKIKNDTAAIFVNGLIKSGHTSVLEHGTVYLKLTDDLYEPTGSYARYDMNQYSRVKLDEENSTKLFSSVLGTKLPLVVIPLSQILSNLVNFVKLTPVVAVVLTVTVIVPAVFPSSFNVYLASEPVLVFLIIPL